MMQEVLAVLGPNDPLNPDIPDPDEQQPGTPTLPVEPPEDDDFAEGDTPEAVPEEPGDAALEAGPR
jgi:hypothetical protein